MVYYGFCDDTIPVAVKELNDVSNPEELYSEAFNMRQLRHPRLVSLQSIEQVSKFTVQKLAAFEVWVGNEGRE